MAKNYLVLKSFIVNVNISIHFRYLIRFIVKIVYILIFI